MKTPAMSTPRCALLALLIGLLCTVSSAAVIESGRVYLDTNFLDSAWFFDTPSLTEPSTQSIIAGCAITCALAACAALCAWLGKWELTLTASCRIMCLQVLVAGAFAFNGEVQLAFCSNSPICSEYLGDYTVAKRAGISDIHALIASFVAIVILLRRPPHQPPAATN
jgi:hypothetical protein